MGDEVELMMVWIQTRWRFGSPARQHYGNDTWLQRIAMDATTQPDVPSEHHTTAKIAGVW
jgi:hypothetical protein